MLIQTASPIEAWDNFYVIVGSTAGALTGLQFVVMTLIAEAGPSRARGETISAFGTPNVVHFCAALLIAALLSVPWTGLKTPGIVVAACGAAGILYAAVVFRRALRQRGYQPVFEDWLWHTFLPTLAYGSIFAAGLALARNFANALFVIGPAVLLLVFVGIHNAWDTVTYMMATGSAREQTTEAPPDPVSPERAGPETPADRTPLP